MSNFFTASQQRESQKQETEQLDPFVLMSVSSCCRQPMLNSTILAILINYYNNLWLQIGIKPKVANNQSSIPMWQIALDLGFLQTSLLDSIRGTQKKCLGQAQNMPKLTNCANIGVNCQTRGIANSAIILWMRVH